MSTTKALSAIAATSLLALMTLSPAYAEFPRHHGATGSRESFEHGRGSRRIQGTRQADRRTGGNADQQFGRPERTLSLGKRWRVDSQDGEEGSALKSGSCPELTISSDAEHCWRLLPLRQLISASGLGFPTPEAFFIFVCEIPPGRSGRPRADLCAQTPIARSASGRPRSCARA